MGLLRRRKGGDDLGDDPFADSAGGDPFGSNQQDSDPFGGQESQGTHMNQSPHAQQTPQQQFPSQALPEHIDTNNPDFNQQMGITKPEQMSPPQDFFTQGRTENNNQSIGSNTSGASGHIEKDLQIIIAKIDALKSELDSIHQRVQKIEKIAETDQQAAIEQQRKQQTYRRW